MRQQIITYMYIFYILELSLNENEKKKSIRAGCREQKLHLKNETIPQMKR